MYVYRSTLILLLEKCMLGLFRNPQNSDMDYRIFSVRTSSSSYMRIRTGGWAHRQRVSTAFLLGKAHNFFLCSWRDSNLSPMAPESDALPIEPHRHPSCLLDIRSVFQVWLFMHSHVVCTFCTLCCPNGNFSHGKFGSLWPRKASCNRAALPTLINYKLHAGSFCVSAIHRTLTWATGS